MKRFERNLAQIICIFVISFLFAHSADAAGPGNVSSGLTLWFNAASSTFTNGACTTAATDGQTLGCWKDLSGNNRHANSASNTPTLITNAINGSPFIAFDKPNTSSNTGDMFTLTGVNLSDIITTSAYSLVFVGSIDNGYSATGGQEAMVIRDSTADPNSKWNLQIADNFAPRLAINHTASAGYTNPYTFMRDSFGSNTFSTPVMLSSTFTTGTKVNVMTGATNVSGATPGNITSVTGGVILGSEASGTRYDFNIAELLVFNRTITATERQQIESHLAIKYGLTLSSHTNFVQHTNYLDTTGAIIWNGFTAGTEFSYHSDVTAIGRHDASNLNQTSSKSVNTTSILRISDPTDLGDGEYFFVGRDDPGTYTSPIVSSFTTTGAPAGAYILNRKWRARETGEVGTTTFAFDMNDSQFDVPVATSSVYYFINDTDGDSSLADETSIQMYDDGATGGDLVAGDNIWTIEKNIGTGLFTIASETNNFEGTVYVNEGVTNIGAGKTVRMLVNGLSASTAITDSNGHFVMGRIPPSNGAVLTFHIDGATEDGVTVSRFDGSTLTGYNIYQDRLIVRTENGTPLSNTDLDTAHDADADITSIYTNGLTTTLTVANNKELLVWAGDTFTPSGPINIGTTAAGNGGLDVNGNLDAATSSIVIRGDFDVDNAGTFTHTGTLTFNGSTLDYYNQGDDAIGSSLVISNSSGSTLGVRVATSSNPVNVTNLTTSAGTNNFDLNGNNLTVSGAFSNNGILTLRGNESTALTQDFDSGTWTYVGDGDAATDTFIIKDFGVTDYFTLSVISTDTNDVFELSSTTNIASNFALQKGVVNTNSFNFTTSGTYTQSLGPNIFNASASNITIGTSFTLGATAGAGNPSVFNAGSGTTSVGTTFSQTGTSPSMSTFNASSGPIIIGTNFSKSGTGSTFNGSSGTMTINGNFTSSSGGPFYAPTSTLTLGGNLTTTSSGGVFNANGGSVVLTSDTNHTFGGSIITFNNLTFLDTGLNNADSILTLSSSNTYTIIGTLTLDGFDTDDRVNIVSSAPGTATSFSFTGTSTFSGDFLDITDNYVADSSSALNTPINPANSIDGGNTLAWFGIVAELSSIYGTSTDESVANNFPVLLVNGTLVSSATVEADINGGGTATFGVDYTSADPILITIPAGTYDGTTSTAITITVPTLVQDLLIEGNETITFTLQNPSGIILGDASNNGTIESFDLYTITDDDVVNNPHISISTVTNASEPSTDGLILFTLSTTSTSTIDIGYTVTGSATNGTDYTTISGTTTMASGTTTASLAIDVIDDLLIEGQENILFTVTGTNIPYIVASSTASTTTVTIADDDSYIVSISATDNSGSEPGTDDVTFTVSLNTTNITGSAINVGYIVSGTASSTSGDFTALSGTTTMLNNASTSIISIDVLDDILLEGSETIILTLIAVDNASTSISAATSTDTATIIDDEFDFEDVSISSISNASEPALPGYFLLTLSTTSTTTMDVGYSISGSAVNGTDYSTISGTTTIGVGTTTRVITISPIDDVLVEGSESLTLTITGTNYGVFIASSTASSSSILVLDDDSDKVSIATSIPNASEPSTDGEFTLSISSSTSTTTDVGYTITGSGTNGTDYQTISATTTIPANATSTTILIDIIDDVLVEGTETVIITLTGISNSLISINASLSSSTVSIADNDVPPKEISIRLGSNAAEPGTDGSFIFSTGLVSTSSVDISYSIGGSATSGTDYQTISGTITLPANATLTILFIDVIDDLVLESSEDIILTLTGVTSIDPAVLLSATTSATAVIVDDESASVSISATTQAAEPSTDGVFTLLVSNATSTPIDVGYTISGTAIGGTDYQTISGTTTILANATSTTILVDVIDDLVIEGGETVIITLNATDNVDIPISAPLSATVNIADDNDDDLDNDGVTNAFEDAGFNGGDANGDGTLDRIQNQVLGNTNPVTGARTTLEASGACSFIRSVSFADESSNTSQDSNASYPVGLANFLLQCPLPGDSATVKFYFTEVYDTTTWTLYKKYSTTTGSYTDLTSIVTPVYGTSTVGGTDVTTIAFVVTDGNTNTDEDLLANTFIYDPSGPAIFVSMVEEETTRRRSSGTSRTRKPIVAIPIAPDPVIPRPKPSGALDLIGGGEPNVPPEFSDYVCTRYMRSYIVSGRENNPEEVKKLQQFLNEFEGEKLSLDGTYDPDDIEAINRFQFKYADQILAPWGLVSPSGVVGRTTTAKINIMMCSTQKGCPYFNSYQKKGDTSLDIVKIQDFINIIFSPTSGYPTNGIPLDKTFGNETLKGIYDFQNTYKEVVLKPWGLTNATGWWYKTTKATANKLMNCPEGEIELDNGVRFQ